jgi:aspartyl-tRNA(Asn)/glutamyl-tRNA(Gln) amidotransferase subunit C
LKISLEETRHIARLARLHLDEADTARMAAELGSILSYVEKLGELDTRNVEPTSHALEVSNVWRNDEVGPLVHDRELMLGQAPRFADGFFIVPRVIE